MRFLCKLLLVIANVCLLTRLGVAQSPAPVAFELPSLLSSGCVLQRNARVPFWGKGQPGQNVTIEVSWSRNTFSGQIRPDGNWWIPIPTPAAGGPYQVGLHCMKTDVVLEDVLIGEVWVCSGQSNMEMPVGPIHAGYTGVQNFEEELANADYPRLRLFTVPNKIAMAPQADCGGTWSECSAATLREFSSTAYFFGRELHRELGVPVGVISADYGGSRAEAWMSARALRGQAGFERIGELLESNGGSESVLMEIQAEAAREWVAEVERRDSELGREWSDGLSSLDGESWGGLLWSRFEVSLDAETLAGPVTLRWLSATPWISAYVNGQRLGTNDLRSESARGPQALTLSPEAMHVGTNVILVSSFYRSGTTTPEAFRALHAIEVSRAAGVQSLQLVNWQFSRGLELDDFLAPPNYPLLDNSLPTGLFNAMIAPIMPYGIRGVVWYQGESNHDLPEQYRSLFPALIRDWRGWWRQGDFPFYFVQIAPFGYDPDRGRPADLRAAQRVALELPNTGMVATLDIGNAQDIHPKNKQEVGRRLALWALAKDYGREELVYSGPLDVGVEVEGDALRVRFDYVGGGLVAAKGGLRHFELAGADLQWHAAQAEIDGNTVVLRSDVVTNPAHVRYCGGAADVGTLFNRAGLPAPSFTR